MRTSRYFLSAAGVEPQEGGAFRAGKARLLCECNFDFLGLIRNSLISWLNARLKATLLLARRIPTDPVMYSRQYLAQGAANGCAVSIAFFTYPLDRHRHTVAEALP